MISIHRQSRTESESEEEYQMRIRTTRKSSKSPHRADGKRTISHASITTYSVENDSSNDIENIGAPKPKTPSGIKSSHSLKQRSSPKRSEANGVRKTSGRVGSMNTANQQARKISGH